MRRQNRVVRRDTRTASSLERGQPLTDFEKMRAAKGLGSEGVGAGGQWLSASTRHGASDLESAAGRSESVADADVKSFAFSVVLYVGAIVDDDLDQTQLDSLTLDVDPEDEFTWTDEALAKVYSKFEELVAGYAGSPLNDYVLRLIGSDLEHYIRQLLLAGELKYNLNHRALNYSMGRPRLEGLGDDLDERK